jgi:hypothetical protein
MGGKREAVGGVQRVLQDSERLSVNEPNVGNVLRREPATNGPSALHAVGRAVSNPVPRRAFGKSSRRSIPTGQQSSGHAGRYARGVKAGCQDHHLSQSGSDGGEKKASKNRCAPTHDANP